MSYQYKAPPKELILCQAKLLERIPRPSPARSMQNRSRDGKDECYYDLRNMCMKWGISHTRCATLAGTYPDEVAISLYPVITGLQCFETDLATYKNMLPFVQGWNELSSVKFELSNSNILDATPNCKVHDLDFMGQVDKVYDKVIAYVNRIQQLGPVCVSLWNSYAMKGLTEKQHLALLDQLIVDLDKTFVIRDMCRSKYIDNHIPMSNQTLVITAKGR
jgi:hypothetical protein